MLNKDQRFKETLFDLATQYYVAARLAAQAGLAPVHGNLFENGGMFWIFSRHIVSLRWA